MKHRELLIGWIAFAVAGVSAVAGGHADSPHRAIIYVLIGIGLAVAGHWLLTQKASKPHKLEAVNPWLRDLSEATGMTNEHFVKWYQPIAEKQSQSMIEFATHVLKQRRGRIFGVEAGHEAARRNRDRWTYAIFLAAIAHVSGSQTEREKGLSTLLFEIPESAREWLLRNSEVTDTLSNALLTPSGTNPIWQLIDDVMRKSTKPVETAKTTRATEDAKSDADAQLPKRSTKPHPQYRFMSDLTERPDST